MADKTYPHLRSKSWLVVANGEPLSLNTFNWLNQNQCILALDGAIDLLSQWHITPHVLLGDFDSVSTVQLEKSNCLVIHQPDQNATDLEKGLGWLQSLDAQQTDICHAIGSRLDHSLNTLKLLRQFHQPKRPLTLHTATEKIIFYRDQDIMLSGQPGQRVACIGYPRAIINSEGLQYELHNDTLDYLQQSSICNQLKKKQALISLQGEALLIIQREITVTLT